ncbi:MAG: hypothetical protein SFV52_15815 [Saprospiraceae bacterium]|nr:hypothetical protein [Saprospiraceae bacterium]
MSAILTVLLGLIFVMLLFSMLASAILDLIKGWFQVKGKRMQQTLHFMLKDEASRFYSHPYFKILQREPSTTRMSWRKRKREAVAKVDGDAFSTIVMDLLTKDQPSLKSGVDQVHNSDIKDLFQLYYSKTGENTDAFSGHLKKWHAGMMNLMQEAYQRWLQFLNFIIGLVLAVSFNVDPFTIYHHLSSNPEMAEKVANAATTFARTQEGQLAATTGIDETQTKINFLEQNIKAIESPLGIGWKQVEWTDVVNPVWWVYHVLGWIVTAMCVSFGSPFWFDLMKKIISMKDGGSSQAPSTTTIVMPPAPQTFYPPAGNGQYAAPAAGSSPFDIPAGAGASPYDVPAAGTPSPYDVPAQSTLPPTPIPNDENPFDELSGRFDHS